MGEHTHDLMQRLTDGVWHAVATLRMPTGAALPIRMTVLRLDDGSLLVHSPIQFDERLAQSVERQGTVRYILAPNGFHHLFVAQWQARFPEAECWGPKVLSRKRPDLRLDEHFDENVDAPWRPAVQVELIGGMPKVQELALYHVASRTLVVTDLVFNIHNASGALKWVLRLMGTHDRTEMSRLLRLFVKDKSAFGRSIDRLLSLQVDRVIMAHGEVLEGRRCAAFEAAIQPYRTPQEARAAG
jgi:hypothetical protein